MVVLVGDFRSVEEGKGVVSLLDGQRSSGRRAGCSIELVIVVLSWALSQKNLCTLSRLGLQPLHVRGGGAEVGREATGPF